MQGRAAGVDHAQRLGDRRQHQHRVGDGSQVDEEHAVGERLDHLGGDLQRQAGLAGAARPRQRQEMCLGIQQPLPHGRHLALAPDEGCELHR